MTIHFDSHLDAAYGAVEEWKINPQISWTLMLDDDRQKVDLIAKAMRVQHLYAKLEKTDPASARQLRQSCEQKWAHYRGRLAALGMDVEHTPLLLLLTALTNKVRFVHKPITPEANQRINDRMARIVDQWTRTYRQGRCCLCAQTTKLYPLHRVPVARHWTCIPCVLAQTRRVCPLCPDIVCLRTWGIPRGMWNPTDN